MRILHEQIGTFGGITAEAIANLLNGSDVDLGTFLRETIQNSWDARIKNANDNAAIQTNLRFAQISDMGKSEILECLTADGKLDRDLIQQALDSRVLVYSDRGSMGLNGPIRVPRPGDNPGMCAAKRNFINFVWMLGANDGGQNMGGQFGFGKSVFAGASRIKMYAIHTRVKKDDNGHEHRFVICGMRCADQNLPNGTGYTGRFWIGENGTGKDHSVVALNDQAREMAGWFGIDLFAGEETGTTVAIFQPKWHGSANEQHFLRMARRATVKWFWPLLREGNFEFTTSDNTGAIKKAEINGGYAVFAGLFDRCKETDAAISNQNSGEIIEGGQLRELIDNGKVRIVFCQRPFKPLGVIGMAREMIADARLNGWGQDPLRFETQADDDGDAQTIEDLPDPVDTLALIRAPRMVVSYERIDHRAGPDKTVFGVFVAASRKMNERNCWDGSQVNFTMQRIAVEDVLAKSEPPRHDEWNPRNISPEKAGVIAGVPAVNNNTLANMKTIIKRTVEKSKEIFADWCCPPKPRDPGAFEFFPAGEASQVLSTLVFNTLGDGPGIGTAPGTAPGTDQLGSGGDGLFIRTRKVQFPKINDLIQTKMTDTTEGNILFTTKIDANWPSNEEFMVEAVISLIDGDGKKSKLKNLSPIEGTTNLVTFADENSTDNTDDGETKADLMKASESHGFYNDKAVHQISFQPDSMSVILKGGAHYTHKLLTTPGKVLDISFNVKKP